MPASLTMYRNAKPVYKTLEGWDSIPDNIWDKGFNALPKQIHNYIDFDKFILRKGAISADKDKLCIISLNTAPDSDVITPIFFGKNGMSLLCELSKSPSSFNFVFNSSNFFLFKIFFAWIISD